MELTRDEAIQLAEQNGISVKPQQATKTIIANLSKVTGEEYSEKAEAKVDDRKTYIIYANNDPFNEEKFVEGSHNGKKFRYEIGKPTQISDWAITALKSAAMEKQERVFDEAGNPTKQVMVKTIRRYLIEEV